jgi:prepilin-type N-terminal cleavage/methylation domain-containing protein
MKGFTVVELMVSMGILAILFALTVINLGRLPQTTSQSGVIDTLISDIRAQQTQAMSTNSSFGIHFESGSYTLFSGNSYIQGDSANFIVTLDPGLTFTTTFPGSAMIFLPGSGDISGYLSGSDSFTLSSSQVGVVKTLNINKYGGSY